MSHHIGDTNEMNDTPISDSTPHNVADLGMQIRRLERELNAANDRIKRLESGDAALNYSIGLDLQKENDALKQRIKRLEEELMDMKNKHAVLVADVALYEDRGERINRLEEALEGTVKWIVDLANSGDAGFWNPEEESVIIAARAALKKEDKL